MQSGRPLHLNCIYLFIIIYIIYYIITTFATDTTAPSLKPNAVTPSQHLCSVPVKSVTDLSEFFVAQSGGGGD